MSVDRMPLVEEGQEPGGPRRDRIRPPPRTREADPSRTSPVRCSSGSTRRSRADAPPRVAKLQASSTLRAGDRPGRSSEADADHAAPPRRDRRPVMPSTARVTECVETSPRRSTTCDRAAPRGWHGASRTPRGPRGPTVQHRQPPVHHVRDARPTPRRRSCRPARRPRGSASSGDGRGEHQVHAVEVLVPAGRRGAVEVVVVDGEQLADRALDTALLAHLADHRRRGDSPWSMPPPGSVHEPGCAPRPEIRVSSTASSRRISAYAATRCIRNGRWSASASSTIGATGTVAVQHGGDRLPARLDRRPVDLEHPRLRRVHGTHPSYTIRSACASTRRPSRQTPGRWAE